jgi:hypothetical protein
MKLTELQALHAREKRNAAIHEAAHAVLVRKFGGVATPSIWRNQSNSAEQKAWLGTCRTFGLPGQVRFQRGLKKRFGILRAPKLWELYVALAGFVAEQMKSGESQAWVIAEAYSFACQEGEISSTDLALLERIGSRAGELQIAKTMDYLRRFWAEIEEQARLLERDET